jgi:hypothetical protein
MALAFLHQNTQHLHKMIGMNEFELQRDGNLKLTGFAQFNSSWSTEHIPYLSPELAALNTQTIQQASFTTKTDIWAVGAMLYDLCC